jgi:hypothetical protein
VPVPAQNLIGANVELLDELGDGLLRFTAVAEIFPLKASR